MSFASTPAPAPVLPPSTPPSQSITAASTRQQNDLLIQGNLLIGIDSTKYTNRSKVQNIVVPHGVEKICSDVFMGCTGLTSITLPKSVTEIESGAFCDCSGLTSITLPQSLARVSCMAFGRCSGLTSLALPHSLISVGPAAFAQCTGLTSVAFRRALSSCAFVSWAVSSMRNRANWQLTTLKRCRNVLRIITEFAIERRDVAAICPGGHSMAFCGCYNIKDPRLKVYAPGDFFEIRYEGEVSE